MIEGIGPANAERLANAEITHTDHLLDRCGSKAGRQTVAEQTGLSESRLLEWTNMADLFRIWGVGSQYAELLEASGVDTVKELATRNAANLVARMNEVNAEKKLSGQVPAVVAVEAWIAEAKTLPARIAH
jgi:predicted flap endonuclease-1-like 5' DNA nuclease